MKESDISRIVEAFENALEVFRNNRDRLQVADIRVQSMIAALKSELIERLHLMRLALE